jgi:hypothetical protein
MHSDDPLRRPSSSINSVINNWRMEGVWLDK